MVLLVHGGPWGRDHWGSTRYAQWLANRGYAVLQVNFRGRTGYGRKFMSAGNRQWGKEMQTDLLDALDWAVKEGVAQKDRVAIMGGSYGGYATLAAAAFSPDVFRCGVDIVGPSNLFTLLRRSRPYWKPLKSSSSTGASGTSTTRRTSSSSRPPRRSSPRTRSRCRSSSGRVRTTRG